MSDGWGAVALNGWTGHTARASFLPPNLSWTIAEVQRAFAPMQQALQQINRFMDAQQTFVRAVELYGECARHISTQVSAYNDAFSAVAQLKGAYLTALWNALDRRSRRRVQRRRQGRLWWIKAALSEAIAWAFGLPSSAVAKCWAERCLDQLLARPAPAWAGTPIPTADSPGRRVTASRRVARGPNNPQEKTSRRLSFSCREILAA